MLTCGVFVNDRMKEGRCKAKVFGLVKPTRYSGLRFHPYRRNHGGMVAPETLTMRATAIAGQRYADDFAVIWHGMPVGWIMLGNRAPHDRPPWTWSCHVHGRPQGSNDQGTGADLDDCKLKFRKAWARIRASLTDQAIADAQQIAAISAEALARYDRRHGR
jgi:hypothetical protein